MLADLPEQSPDALLALIKMYAADPRKEKIDLGVGVYRTDDGATPVFAAVKGAERDLVERQDSKAYLGPEGCMDFVRCLMPIILGDDMAKSDRIDGMQTPGGTGGVRLAVALAQAAGAKRVWMGTPSWPNHAQILKDIGMEAATFNHAADGATDMDALKDAIAKADAGDAFLLHGCCHNPTGIDYTVDQWHEIAAIIAEKGILPILDLAYQGLGEGLDEDAQGVRIVMKAVPEALLAYSCDKNFGLYRDRVGAVYVQAAEADHLPRIMSNAASFARATWSMPPDHGGSVVREIVADDTLRGEWLDELAGMRRRMLQVRARLAEAGTAGSVDLTPLAQQHGLFAMLPLDKDQIQALRKDHAVYMAGSGRINIAGLTLGNIDRFIAALAKVSG
ncbi:aromatic amino acid transaminase [Croceicoccus sp. YJ47]|uniref:amino acid aminotransferase n=1 Tax=Croceicoccus sp. YJ47 TaxID=2798724 RepID=UPI00192193F1|nr:aromatic amino acid transaminase [Croceicoccus sp. YJ47]QQN75716.1 aspartate/tyrosine/aromatic aminotransferase [Croceicoccus sp. YJ47]